MALDLLDPTATDSDHLYEVIDGLPTEMTEMSVISAGLGSLLASLLNEFARKTLGTAFTDVLFKLPLPLDRNRRPDVAFVPYSVWPRTRPLPNTNAWIALPGLCVEVVSPTDLAEEVMTKVTVTERRTIPDFAAQMKYPCDELYPHAAVIRVVPDNPNTHTVGSLFAGFPADEAWRRARRLEFHSTPKHASRPNVAERESSVPAGQCLGRRIPTREQRATEVAARATRRNAEKAKIEWTFRVADARVKLDVLDPKEFPR